MARPTKKEAVVKQLRDREIVLMVGKGYPLDYICHYFGLTKGRVSQITKKADKY